MYATAIELQFCLMATLVTMATATGYCKEFVTFNAGLIISVPEADIRRPKIIDALASSTADVICIQEFWFERDISAVLEHVEDMFPHHYSGIHHSDGVLRKDPCIEVGEERPKDMGCRYEDIHRLTPHILKCGAENGCFEMTGVGQGVCLALKCAHVLRSGAASETCISCLFNNVGASFQETVAICATPSTVHNRFNSPGLLMLSKGPLKNVGYYSYFPKNKMAFQRGYIEAELDDGKLAVCTHLSSDSPFYIECNYFRFMKPRSFNMVSPDPYILSDGDDLPFGTYENQSKAEIAVLGERFSDQDIVLMGDINAGPEVIDNGNPEKDLKAELPASYEMLLALGYRSPYLQQDGRCTFCSANPYVRNAFNKVIDHVMIRNNTNYNTELAVRTFDKSTPPLSDHYGVKVIVCS